MRRKPTIVYLLIFFTTCLLHAQTDSTLQEGSFHLAEIESGDYDEAGYVKLASISLGQLMPVNAFRQKVNFNLFAINIDLQHQVKKNKPLFVGLGYTYMPMQSFTGDVPIAIDGFTEFWSSTTSTGMHIFDLNALYYFPVNLGKMNVFSQLKFGFNWFSTRTSLVPPNSEETEGYYNKNDLVGIYGAGLGVHYPLGKNGYIQLRCQYQAGLSAFYYLKKDQIPSQYEDTIEAFELQKSTTDAIKWDLGYTFAF